MIILVCTESQRLSGDLPLGMFSDVMANQQLNVIKLESVHYVQHTIMKVVDSCDATSGVHCQLILSLSAVGAQRENPGVLSLAKCLALTYDEKHDRSLIKIRNKRVLQRYLQALLPPSTLADTPSLKQYICICQHLTK